MQWCSDHQAKPFMRTFKDIDTPELSDWQTPLFEMMIQEKLAPKAYVRILQIGCRVLSNCLPIRFGDLWSACFVFFFSLTLFILPNLFQPNEISKFVFVFMLLFLAASIFMSLFMWSVRQAVDSHLFKSSNLHPKDLRTIQEQERSAVCDRPYNWITNHHVAFLLLFAFIGLMAMMMLLAWRSDGYIGWANVFRTPKAFGPRLVMVLGGSFATHVWLFFLHTCILDLSLFFAWKHAKQFLISLQEGLKAMQNVAGNWSSFWLDAHKSFQAMDEFLEEYFERITIMVIFSFLARLCLFVSGSVLVYGGLTKSWKDEAANTWFPFVGAMICFISGLGMASVALQIVAVTTLCSGKGTYANVRPRPTTLSTLYSVVASSGSMTHEERRDFQSFTRYVEMTNVGGQMFGVTITFDMLFKVTASGTALGYVVQRIVKAILD